MSISFKVDVYSTGVVGYVLLTGTFPFCDHDIDPAAKHDCDGGCRKILVDDELSLFGKNTLF